MNTPPMTLEETKEALQALRNRGTPHMQATVDSALHHLEAGKRDAELLAEIHQIAAYPSYCATDLIGDPEAESKLRERIADMSALSPQPQQEVQG